MRRLTVAEQVAAHLREGLRQGHWAGSLPGVARLAAELEVSTNTVQAALRMLESEGAAGRFPEAMKAGRCAPPGFLPLWGSEPPLRDSEPTMNERRSHHYETPDTPFPGTNANQPWKNLCYT